MANDPIIDETRKIRDQIAAEYGYDIYRMGEYFMNQQKKERREIISRPRMQNKGK